jgi:hypothetical protein
MAWRLLVWHRSNEAPQRLATIRDSGAKSTATLSVSVS